MKFSHSLAILVLSTLLFVCAPCAADPPTATSIVGAKLAADGTPVSLTGAIVTAVSMSTFYVEADNRSSGIYVLKASHGLQAGVRTDIAGAVQTDPDGERYIAATTATENGSGSVQPIAMSNRDLGGSDLPSGITGGGQKGVPGGVGPNNIGLLVRVRGRVTYGGFGTYYIDDGAGLLDGSGYRGVKVVGRLPLALEMDPVGWYVEVTGLSSLSRAGDNLCRCVLAISNVFLNEVETPSGLVYADLRVGTGATADWGETVGVYYTLWLTDGLLVDSNMDSGTPFEFTAGQGAVIPGFQEGIVGMKEGGKRFLIIPPELGYGEEGMPGMVPPNAVLLFEVELVSVE